MRDAAEHATRTLRDLWLEIGNTSGTRTERMARAQAWATLAVANELAGIRAALETIAEQGPGR